MKVSYFYQFFLSFYFLVMSYFYNTITIGITTSKIIWSCLKALLKCPYFQSSISGHLGADTSCTYNRINGISFLSNCNLIFWEYFWQLFLQNTYVINFKPLQTQNIICSYILLTYLIFFRHSNSINVHFTDVYSRVLCFCYQPNCWILCYLIQWMLLSKDI